jgi:hypothetical protein
MQGFSWSCRPTPVSIRTSPWSVSTAIQVPPTSQRGHQGCMGAQSRKRRLTARAPCRSASADGRCPVYEQRTYRAGPERRCGSCEWIRQTMGVGPSACRNEATSPATQIRARRTLSRSSGSAGPCRGPPQQISLPWLPSKASPPGLPTRTTRPWLPRRSSSPPPPTMQSLPCLARIVSGPALPRSTRSQSPLRTTHRPQAVQ